MNRVEPVWRITCAKAGVIWDDDIELICQGLAKAKSVARAPSTMQEQKSGARAATLIGD